MRFGPSWRETTGPRAAAALALFRSTDPALVPLLAAAIEDGDAETRRSAAWALARAPRPGSEDALRGLLDDADPEIVAWAARGTRAPRGRSLRAEAPRARDRGRTGPGDPGPPRPRPPRGQEPDGGRCGCHAGVALARARDANPGVAMAALTLLRRFAGEAPVAGSSWRRWPSREAGGGASRSRASPRATPTGPLRSRTPRAGQDLSTSGSGRPKHCRSFRPDGSRRGSTLSSRTRPPGSGWRPISRLPRDAAPSLASRLVRALADSDGSVQAVALDIAAPLASGSGADAAVQPGLERGLRLGARLPRARPRRVGARRRGVACRKGAARSWRRGGTTPTTSCAPGRGVSSSRSAARIPARFPAARSPRVSRAPTTGGWRRLAESGRLVATVSTTRGRSRPSSFRATLR